MKAVSGQSCVPTNSGHGDEEMIPTSSTRGLLGTDHVILNHDQVTWTIPELSPPFLTPTSHQREDVSALDRFNVHRCPTQPVWQYDLARFHPNFEGGHLGVVRGLPPLYPFHQPQERTCSSTAILSTPCRKGTIHLQTSMSSPGFEPSPYGTAVSIANHYTGWA
ncbi:uncharacterized protein TNCV_704141 [Trichonephila clavipes]|nr:uncharacterized protein TNCV_704141 [Trichonephila clavipes]